ncbi:MAG: glutamate racemase [Inquilinus sp.]|nr:glutamate racemase [Inquilinus sp.]
MIGVFDSGNGGLTVLRALAGRLPGPGFAYLGDHANAPYGDRPAEAVYRLTVENVERLFGLGCRLVLLACNTASAVALRRLQRHWLPGVDGGRRVLGVLVPVVEPITLVPWQVNAPPSDRPTPPATIGVFATPRTVTTGAFAYEIGRRAPAVTVLQQACPGLVAAIEADAPAAEIAGLVAGFVAALQERCPAGRPDTVVLGCTHFPLVADAFAAALPAGVPILDQPRLVADSLEAYLRRHPDFDDGAGGGAAEGGGIRFLSTGCNGATAAVASRFFGRPVVFERVG